jgi:Flp pilus assembly pilin Flp
MRFAFLKLYSGLQRFLKQEEGQDLVEYALVILMLAIATVAASENLGASILNLYTYIDNHFPPL